MSRKKQAQILRCAVPSFREKAPPEGIHCISVRVDIPYAARRPSLIHTSKQPAAIFLCGLFSAPHAVQLCCLLRTYISSGHSADSVRSSSRTKCHFRGHLPMRPLIYTMPHPARRRTPQLGTGRSFFRTNGRISAVFPRCRPNRRSNSVTVIFHKGHSGSLSPVPPAARPQLPT